jgi:hypothetical protein
MSWRATLSLGIEVAFAFDRKQLKFGVPRPLVVSEVESIAVPIPSLRDLSRHFGIRDAKGASSIFSDQWVGPPPFTLQVRPYRP